MIPRHAFTSSADLSADVPAAAGARLDRAERAMLSLRGELERLERMELELAARRCREQLRYWEFVHAIFAIVESPERGGVAA